MRKSNWTTMMITINRTAIFKKTYFQIYNHKRKINAASKKLIQSHSTIMSKPKMLIIKSKVMEASYENKP